MTEKSEYTTKSEYIHKKKGYIYMYYKELDNYNKYTSDTTKKNSLN